MRERGVTALGLICCLTFLGSGLTFAEPSYELTARYILDVVKAFRTAYLLHVVEHTKESGLSTREDWAGNAHALPLPAQFVKEAAGQVKSVEIGLISLTPVNPSNRPRTDAEVEALLQLEKDRSRGVVTFVDGNQFKAVSADLALVRSCVDCHNAHPRASRRNFEQWDVMGGLVVRMNRDAQPPALQLPPEPQPRPGSPERIKPPTFDTPWLK